MADLPGRHHRAAPATPAAGAQSENALRSESRALDLQALRYTLEHGAICGLRQVGSRDFDHGRISRGLCGTGNQDLHNSTTVIAAKTSHDTYRWAVSLNPTMRAIAVECRYTSGGCPLGPQQHRRIRNAVVLRSGRPDHVRGRVVQRRRSP